MKLLPQDRQFCVSEPPLLRGARLLRGLLALSLAGVAAVAFLMPAEGLPLTVCWFRELTGASCLTCGMTRSLHAASHGQLLAALQYHAAGPLLLLGTVAVSVLLGAEGVLGRRLRPIASVRALKNASLSLLALWIVYGIVRAILELTGQVL